MLPPALIARLAACLLLLLAGCATSSPAPPPTEAVVENLAPAGPYNQESAALFAPNGAWLATHRYTSIGSAGDESEVTLWHPTSGERLRSWLIPGAASCLTVSPDSSLLASCPGGLLQPGKQIKLWRAADGAMVRAIEIGQDDTFQLWFSPDGRELAAAIWLLDGVGQELRRFRVADGALLGTLPMGRGNMALAPDWSVLAAGPLPEAHGEVSLYPLSGDAPRPLLDLDESEPSGTLWGVAFSPDGRALATSDSNGDVQLWATSDGTLLQSFAGQTGIVHELAFSPDGTLLAGLDYDDRSLRLWRAEDGESLRRFEAGEPSGGVVFSPDGQLLATRTLDGIVMLWKVADDSFLLRINPEG